MGRVRAGVVVKRRLVVVVPIVLVVVLAVAVTNVFPFRRMLALDRAIASEQAVLEATLVENDALREERDALLTDDEVERVAREKYGYVMPGEQPYVVVTPEGSLRPSVVVEDEADEPRTWYDPIVDFLTGRDLTGG